MTKEEWPRTKVGDIKKYFLAVYLFVACISKTAERIFIQFSHEIEYILYLIKIE